jgi:hypothetical protein
VKFVLTKDLNVKKVCAQNGTEKSQQQARNEKRNFCLDLSAKLLE